MAPKRIRSRRRQGELLKLLLGAILLGLALIGGGVGVYVYATASRPPLRDQKTFCPLDGLRSVTVMLLDTSDPLPKPTKDEVIKLLNDIAETLPDYALLEIRILDPGSGTGQQVFSRQVFSLCNPGDGRGLNEFTGNPALAKKRWQERFRKPMEEALKGALQPQPSKTSPLLATLQGIAIEHFIGKAANEIPKSLIIVSDMIENTKEYDQYPPHSRDVSYKRFKTTPAYLKYRTDLNGAEVVVFYVSRLPPAVLDPVAHIQFWVDWAQDSRGKSLRAVRLQGAG